MYKVHVFITIKR